MAKTPDAMTVLQQLEADEAEQLRAFQEQMRAKREKALGDLLKPLKDERGKLSQERNEADLRIAEIDRQISKLTGRTERPKVVRRERMNRAAKLQIAQIVYGLLKQNSGKRYSSRDLEGQSSGVAVRDLVKVWNDDHKDQRIGVEGEKVNTRYFVGR